MSKYIAGIDIGGTSVKIGMFLVDGTLVEKYSIPTNTRNNGERILFEIASSITSKYDSSEIVGYGFGVPGPVINNHILKCVNLHWGKKDLISEFGSYVNNYKIRVSNDANVATLGEDQYGAGAGHENIVMLTLGTGVGGGVVAEGHIVEGAFGAAGEFGHIKIDFTYNFSCNCGSSGCLETVASATGLKNILREVSKNNYNTSLTVNNASARDIMEAAKQKDELALKVVDIYTDYLAYTCHVISLSTNPSMFVFGGGVSNAGDFLLDKIKSKYSKYPFVDPADYSFKVAKLGNDAGIYGGFHLIKETLD